MGKVKFDLARSSLRPVSKEELSFPLSELRFSRSPDLKIEEVIAGQYGIDPTCVEITSGATMSVFALFSSILEKGDEILLEAPNFESLYRIPHRLGATIKVLERDFEKGFQIDLEELEQKIGRNTKAIVITNLHNPSGQETNVDKLVAIGQIAHDYKAYVVSVEVYLDNALTSGLKPAVLCGDNMISINSLKVYGLDGLRIGWVASTLSKVTERVRVICKDYIYGDLPAPTESIAQFALVNRNRILESSRELIQKNIEIIDNWIPQNGLQWVRPKGGTICFVKLPPGVDDMRLSNLLRDHYSTLVVPGNFFWKKGFIRISFGVDSPILIEGLNNISSALASQKVK